MEQLWRGYLVEARDDANFHFSLASRWLFTFNAISTLILYFRPDDMSFHFSKHQDKDRYRLSFWKHELMKTLKSCHLSFREYLNRKSRVTQTFDFSRLRYSIFDAPFQ